jgi:hypothetical protein
MRSTDLPGDSVVGISSDAGARRYLQALAPALRIPTLNTSAIDLTGIRLLITGSAIGPSADETARHAAKRAGIPCVSVIEHWTWFRRRFESDGVLQLPDWILVNDAVAKQAALAEGLPGERLIVLGNPILESLLPLRAAAAQPEREHIEPLEVLFISEDMTGSGSRGVAAELGYDEYSVLESLLDVVGTLGHVTVKLHPAEVDSKFVSFADRIEVLREANVVQLARTYDVIVGMDSMLLLELAVLRRDVISFRPTARFDFAMKELGAVITVSSLEELACALRQSKFVPRGFADGFLGSGVRIVNFLTKLAQ